MSQPSNFIEGNDNFCEQNLRFVRNELEDNLNQLLGGASATTGAPPRDYKIVQPTPGFCVKSFKLNTNDKFFVNVCKTPEVPAPRDISEDELLSILKSPSPSSYRVPMSLSEPRVTKDRSNNNVDVCDIAINPYFLQKVRNSELFKSFFLQIIGEALSEKYNVQIMMDKIIILANRKFLGTLVSHRVRNDDVIKTKMTQEGVSGQSPPIQLLSSDQSTQLVQEIDKREAQMLQKKSAELRYSSKSSVSAKEPLYKLRARIRNDAVHEIYAELYMPHCVSSHELSLDIGEDRILVESMKHGYLFDKFVNYRLHQDRAQALFDKTSKMLQIRIPIFT